MGSPFDDDDSRLTVRFDPGPCYQQETVPVALRPDFLMCVAKAARECGDNIYLQGVNCETGECLAAFPSLEAQVHFEGRLQHHMQQIAEETEIKILPDPPPERQGP